jgi:hypothetical protein
MEENKSVAEKSIDDLWAEAWCDDDTVPEYVEVPDPEKERKNEAARAYYATNKDKIKATRKKATVGEKKKQCEKHGVPDYLAEFISFREDGRISLMFKDEGELFRVLHWLKFKSTYTEDVLKSK